MALKLFCSTCHEFMKEITPDEAGRLPEKVVCKKCVDFTYDLKDQLQKDYQKLNQMLSSTYNKAMVKLEETIHKALD
jgi:predicted metal-binding protein